MSDPKIIEILLNGCLHGIYATEEKVNRFTLNKLCLA